MHARQNAKILNMISSVSSTNIGESIKSIRYTGYCNNCYNSSGINLYFWPLIVAIIIMAAGYFMYRWYMKRKR